MLALFMNMVGKSRALRSALRQNTNQLTRPQPSTTAMAARPMPHRACIWMDWPPTEPSTRQGMSTQTSRSESCRAGSSLRLP